MFDALLHQSVPDTGDTQRPGFAVWFWDVLPAHWFGTVAVFAACDDFPDLTDDLSRWEPSNVTDILLDEKPGFTGTGAADYQHILISCVARVFWAVRHHQPFRLRQDHIVLKYRVFKGSNILMCTPTGASVLHIFPKFLGIFALYIHDYAENDRNGNADEKISDPNSE